MLSVILFFLIILKLGLYFLCPPSLSGSSRHCFFHLRFTPPLLLSLLKQFFKAQAAQKQAERENLLKKMSSEQREKFLAEEGAAKQHDAAKSRHVLKTTGMFKASSGNVLVMAGGRGGRGGRGGTARARVTTSGTS